MIAGNIYQVSSSASIPHTSKLYLNTMHDDELNIDYTLCGTIGSKYMDEFQKNNIHFIPNLSYSGTTNPEFSIDSKIKKGIF